MLVIGSVMMIKLLRVVFLLPGGILVFIHLCKDGSRDLLNKIRFKNSKIARGSSIDSNSILFEHTTIGTDTILNNTKMKSYSYIGNNCLIQFTEIGKFCSIGSNIQIGLGVHPLNYLTTSPVFYKKNNPIGSSLVNQDLFFEEYKITTINDDVWIGNGVIIPGGIKIGQGSVIASGCVVTKDVPPYAIVAGVPAKIVKYRFKEEVIKLLCEHKLSELSTEALLQLNDTIQNLDAS